MAPPEALRLWNNLPHDTLAAAYLGKRVAADRRAAGDERSATAILDESRGARERAGLEEPRDSRAVKKEGATPSAWCCRCPVASARSASGPCAARCWPPT